MCPYTAGPPPVRTALGAPAPVPAPPASTRMNHQVPPHGLAAPGPHRPGSAGTLAGSPSLHAHEPPCAPLTAWPPPVRTALGAPAPLPAPPASTPMNHHVPPHGGPTYQWYSNVNIDRPCGTFNGINTSPGSPSRTIPSWSRVIMRSSSLSTLNSRSDRLVIRLPAAARK